jgi:hypothetical protein
MKSRVVNPFVFGKLAGKNTFTNRKRDIEELSSLINNGISTILISPRRWGKSSLVQRVKEKMERQPEIRFCMIDMFSIASEEEFYRVYAKSVIQSSSNKMEEWLAAIKRFLENVSPRISFGVDPVNDFDISLDYEERRTQEEVLNLPERLACHKGVNLVICLDEFQNIEFFDKPREFQKKLRAQFQRHEHVTYLMYGSKRHMMANLFSSRSMPFYKFGEVIYLDKIGLQDWIAFISKQFSKSGKNISAEFAGHIADRVECHPYYVQQFSYHVWELTKEKVTGLTLMAAMETMLDRNSLLFEREFEQLSKIQIYLVRAIASGYQAKLMTKKVIKQFALSSSAAVASGLAGLEKKEIIDRFTKNIEFVDPLFGIWIRRLYRIQIRQKN